MNPERLCRLPETTERKTEQTMKTLLMVAIGGVALYAGLSALVYFFQRFMVYHPDTEMRATPAALDLDYEEVTITTRDGERLGAWFVPHPDSRGVVLYFHGNAGNISERVDLLPIFHDLHLSTCIIDYRGYGRSTGRPTEAGTYRDAEAAWHYLTDTRGIPPHEIIIHGCSLGGAIALWLAAQHRPGVLVVGSTFLNIRRIAREMFPVFPVTLLSRIKYDNLKRIRQVHCPVLVMHSTEDDLIPFEHGRKLFAAANPPKEFLELRGEHGDALLVSREQLRGTLDAFLNKYFDRSSDPLLRNLNE